MNFIDLFAGAGGLSEGFIRAGYTPIAHVEMDAAASYTLKTREAYHYLKGEGKKSIYEDYLKGIIDRNTLYNQVPKDKLESIINMPIGPEFNKQIHESIRKQLGDKEVDLIVGGPPCQAYSLVGRARSKDGMATDPRNHLYIQYADYLEKYQPKMFVFENVLGLKSAKNTDGVRYIDKMEALFLKKGYKIELFTVEADNFGVLQKRKRVIIIGWKMDFIPTLPNFEALKLHDGSKVESIFSDLPKIQAGEMADKYRTKSNPYLEHTSIRNGIETLTQHLARPNTEQDKKIYRIAVDKWNQNQERLNYNDLPARLKSHENQSSFFDRFKVVAQDLTYSQTVVAHIAKDGHYYIHPDIEQNRSITVREAARLQSFSDNYYFEGVKEVGNRTAAFKQIGNAVPPLMAEQIANTLKPLL